MEKEINIVKNNSLRLILMICGWIMVGLGIIGIFLPVMPTTIFLILAAGCFARSSEKFYNKLITNKYLGHYIRNYRINKAMPLRAKIIAIIMMNLVILSTVFLWTEKLWLQILLLTIAVSVSLYIISIKTLTPDMELSE